jgi:predicted nucleic acid-binding protein
MTLVDTNVLIDILSGDPVWLDWSVASLARRSILGPAFINEVTYAELSARMTSEPVLREALRDLGVELARTPESALFIAGQTFNRYRTAGGVRAGILPDFFIGAHAQFARWAILTRDVRPYRTYFPDVELIAPQG